jgi:ketosteroid isomerase-like protein
MFAEDVVWHQPGAHRFAGTHRGQAAVNEHLGALMSASQGTFELSVTGEPMVNGDLAAMQVEFGAQRDGTAMSMGGVDIVRVEGDRIAEVWLYSQDQRAEDDFWGVADRG